jgi:hypothetical protein
VFNPLTGASDVEGSPLAVQWVSAPAHGSLAAAAAQLGMDARAL